MGVELVVKIVGDVAGLSKALDKGGGEVKGFGGDALAMAGKVTLVGGAAIAAGAAIYGMAKAAAADRDEQNKLEAAIAAAGAATATSTQQVEDAIAAGQDKAFTDSETREALQDLVTATGDVSKSTALLTDAQNIARLAGVDLETASKAVAKAQSGQDGALRKLIPGLKKGASVTDTLAEASALAAGQADLYASSAEGMEAKAGDAFGELTETIGEVFLPVLDAVLPIVIQMIKLFGQLVKAVLPLLVPILKTVGRVLTEVGKVLGIVVGWLIKLVNWLVKSIGKIGQFLDSINPLKGIKLPSLPFLSSASASGLSAGTRAGGSATGGGVTINVNGALDPEGVARQIRRILAGHAVRQGVAI